VSDSQETPCNLNGNSKAILLDYWCSTLLHRQTKFEGQGSEDYVRKMPLQTCISLVGCDLFVYTVCVRIDQKKPTNQENERINGKVVNAHLFYPSYCQHILKQYSQHRKLPPLSHSKVARVSALKILPSASFSQKAGSCGQVRLDNMVVSLHLLIFWATLTL
jgi:hypothetical protein